jgi:hypothetical protein
MIFIRWMDYKSFKVALAFWLIRYFLFGSKLHRYKASLMTLTIPSFFFKSMKPFIRTKILYMIGNRMKSKLDFESIVV